VAVVTWLALAVAALLVLLVLVLALLLLVPVVVDAAWGGERRAVSLAAPGVRVAFDARTRSTELRLFSLRVGRWSGRPGTRRKRARRRRAGGRPSLRKLWLERSRVFSALRAFLRRLRVRRLSLRAVLATPDPALTGWLAGAAYAVRGVAPPGVRRGVVLEPDFASESPRFALDASIRLRPVHAAVLAVRLWRVARRARGGPAGRQQRAGTESRERTRRTARRTGRVPADGQDGGTSRREGGGKERP